MRPLLLAMLFGLVAGVAVAADWGKIATISTTMGVSGSRLCLGEASRGDIGCPAYAPYVNGAGNVGLGTPLPSTALEVSGTISATGLVINGVSITGGAGNLSETISIDDLKDASSTVATGNMFLGASAGNAITTGTGNTSVGVDNLSANTTGSNNVAIGFEALFSNVTGTSNVALGYQALYSNSGGNHNFAVGHSLFNNQADDNVAIGDNALQNTTTGGSNFAVGNAALFFNTTGDSNIAFGGLSLFHNTTGARSIAMGFNSLGNNVSGNLNIALGYGSMSTLTTGDYNIGVGGYNVLGGLISGNYNTAIGPYSTGSNLTSGDGNIAIGAFTTFPNAVGDYQLSIGNAIFGDLSRVSDSRIGINVMTPSVALEVSGTISATRFVGDGSGLTNLPGSATDRIVSGSVSAVAEQASGTVRVSGTLAMVNTGNEVCDFKTWYSLRLNPSTGFVQMCRP